MSKKYASAKNRIWVDGSPYVAVLKSCTDKTAIHMIAKGHESSVKRLKPALKREAPPKLISKKYKSKRYAYSTFRRGQGSLNKTYHPYLKLKNSNAWGTSRDRTMRKKNVGAWIGSKHPAASTAIWNNYGTKNRKYTGAWKTGKSTGKIDPSGFIRKAYDLNKSRLVALGHRDIQDMAMKQITNVSRSISRRSRSLIK